MTHAFDQDEAVRHGVNAAIVLNQLRGWIAYNKANGKNLKEGRTWTYNSVKSWGELFPYLTLKQIRSAIDALRESGVLIKGNFNENPYDRTCWYALADESICLSGQIEAPLSADEIAPAGKSLDQGLQPSKNQSARAEVMGLAEAIYQAYPKKLAKASALKAIVKTLAKVPSEKLLTATLAYAAATSRWPEEDKRFIPYPATWFNRGSYDDDPKNWHRTYDAPHSKTNSRALGTNSNLTAFEQFDRDQVASGS